MTEKEKFIEDLVLSFFDDLKKAVVAGLKEQAEESGEDWEDILGDFFPDEIIDFGFEFAKEITDGCDCSAHRNHAMDIRIIAAFMHDLWHILPKNMSKARKRKIMIAYQAMIYKIDSNFERWVENAQRDAEMPPLARVLVPMGLGGADPNDPKRKPN